MDIKKTITNQNQVQYEITDGINTFMDIVYFDTTATEKDMDVFIIQKFTDYIAYLNTPILEPTKQDLQDRLKSDQKALADLQKEITDLQDKISKK